MSGHPSVLSDVAGHKMVALRTTEPGIISSGSTGSFWALPITCSDPDAAMHYLARLLEVGDLIGACRRILCSASEDVGLAYPQAVPIVKACVDSALQLGLPEAKLPLAEACLLLATSPKSNTACAAIDRAMADVRAGRTGSIPRELQNVHADGAGFEREQGYKYPHNFPGHWVRQQYLPDELKNARYYEYGDNKTEQAARRYWEEIKKN